MFNYVQFKRVMPARAAVLAAVVSFTFASSVFVGVASVNAQPASPVITHQCDNAQFAKMHPRFCGKMARSDSHKRLRGLSGLR